MPRLPDINLQDWLTDQQKRFTEATAGLFPALDFELGAKATESQIPPDFDAPGGMDQWKEAEQQQLAEQYRKQQQDAEAERERQVQEQAAQYAQQQQQAEAAQAQQQQERESSVMDQIRSLGIPTPSDAFAGLQPQGDHTSTSGALDLPYDSRQVDQGAHEAPRSPVDQFNAHATGMMTDAFGAPTPDPNTLPPPDHTSTTGLLDQIGSGVGSAASAANSALTSVGQGARTGADQLGTAIESSRAYQAAFTDPFTGVYTGSGPVQNVRDISSVGDYAIEHAGAGAKTEVFNREAELQAKPDRTPAEEEELRQVDETKSGIVLGSSGTMGGGGLAQDAIAAIKALHAAGLGEAALHAEWNLAAKSTMTLSDIQKQTRGLIEQVTPPSSFGAEVDRFNARAQSSGTEVENPWPLTPEERALNAEADAKAASQPAHGGYLEDASFGAEVPTPESTTFRTAKGSTYEAHPDGTTTRDKAARPDVGHEGDFGPKPQSEATYYLTPENASRLGPPQGTSRVVDHGDGTLSIATLNADGRWGIAPSQRSIPFETEPRVGALPLEVWGHEETFGPGVDAYRNTHFGNEITNIAEGSRARQSEEELARITSEYENRLPEYAPSRAEDPGVTVPSAPPESSLPRLAENATPPLPETARGMPPEQAAREQVPGFHEGAFTPEPRPPGETNWRSEQIGRETTQEARAAVPRLGRAERERRAAEMYGVDPEAVRPLLEQRLERDPNMAAVEEAMLQQHIETVGDLWELTNHNAVQYAERIAALESAGEAVPQSLKLEAAHWVTQGTLLDVQFREATKGHTRGVTSAAKILQAQNRGYQGAVLVSQARQLDEVGLVATEVGEEMLKARQSGKASPELGKKVRELGRKLSSESNIKAVSETPEEAVRTARKSGRGGGGKGGGTRTGTSGAGTPPEPREETLIEKLGRLKREQSRLEGNEVKAREGAPSPQPEDDRGRSRSSFGPGTESSDITPGSQSERDRVASEIDDTLAQMREYARISVEKRMENIAGQTLTPAQVEQAINEAVGRRAQSKMIRDETVKQKGYWPPELVDMGKQIEQGITKYYRDAEKLQKSIDAQIQRRIDGALAQEKNAQARAELRDMAGQAQIFAKALRDAPNELHDLSGQYHEQQFDEIMRKMSEHSNLGERMANDLRERLWDQVGRSITGQEERGYQAGQRALTEARLRAVNEQIQVVVDNPQAPGAMARLDSLYDDIMEISAKAGAKASDRRLTAHKAGILESGLFAKDADPAMILKLLKNIDPDNPTQGLKMVYGVMGRPSIWKALNEIPFINMLSNPVTLGTNVSSTTLNGVGRFAIQSPLEFVGSGGQTRGQVAALGTLKESIPEGWDLLTKTWKSGINPNRANEALAGGDYRHMGRENLPAYLEGLPGPLRHLGVLGVIQHGISTRGLTATDAMLGHIAYGAGFAEQAQREADMLIRTGGRELKAMQAGGTNIADRVAVKDYIISNSWDFPQVIEAAGNIADHTLFRGKGKSPIEVGLRTMVAKNLEPGSVAEIATNILIDFIMPFRNVPVNSTKQGVQLLASPIWDTGAYLGELGKAAVGKGDRRMQGERFAKAVRGLGTVGLATLWASNDNLTGIGPKDEGDRLAWLEDHRINSWRAFKGAPWISYEGTPLAIPLGAVAQAVEDEKYAKKTDPNLSVAGLAATRVQGIVKGGIAGALSNSLAEGVIRNAQFALGQTTGEAQTAQGLAEIIARYSPTGVVAPSGMLNFLATMTDVVERQTAKPRNWDEVPQAVSERLQARIPGLRQTLPERRGAYGELVPNERSVVGSEGASAIPIVGGLYRGYGPGPGDPITESLQSLSVGAPVAPEELTLGGHAVPLTIREQQEFQRIEGQQFRQILEKYAATKAQHGGGYTAEQYGVMRTAARQYAQGQILTSMPREEVQRRLRQSVLNTPVERR